MKRFWLKSRAARMSVAMFVLIIGQLLLASTASACGFVTIDCSKGSCNWGYNAASDTYFPKSYTIGVAQAAAQQAGACVGDTVQVQGTQQVSPGGYVNYFFLFNVESGGTVVFNGESDVSHDQKALPPLKCQIVPCNSFYVGYPYPNMYGTVGAPQPG